MSVADPGGGVAPAPKIVVDFGLGPLARDGVGWKLFFFLLLVFNSWTINNFLIVMIVSFCNQVRNKVSVTLCGLC